jgi:hypothetical protein
VLSRAAEVGMLTVTAGRLSLLEISRFRCHLTAALNSTLCETFTRAGSQRVNLIA